MTPDLALTLSFEGIRLLHRAPEGWQVLGDVSLDTDDLPQALADLRAKAIEAGGDGFCTALILPEDQIKYLTLPGADTHTDLQAAAADALARNTPYQPDQLAFDLHVTEDLAQVAAVARDTLKEAEDFAQEHAFRPVCFTAMPTVAQFGKAPHFGLSQSALAEALTVAPDPVVVEIAAQDIAPASSIDPSAADDMKAEAVNLDAAETTPSEPFEDQPAKPVSTEIDASPVEPASTAPSVAGTQDTSTPLEPLEEQADTIKATAPQDAVSNVARQGDAQPHPAAPLQAQGSDGSLPNEHAPELAGVTRSDDAPSAKPRLTAPSAMPAPSEASAAPPVLDPTKAVAGLKAERRAAKVAASAATLPAPSTNKAAPDTSTRVADPAPTAAAKDPKPDTSDVPPRHKKIKDRRQKPRFDTTSPKVGGKPKYLGLALTTVLIVFLGGVALWASVFTENGISGLFATKSETRVAISDVETHPIDAPATLTPSVVTPPETAGHAPQSPKDTVPASEGAQDTAAAQITPVPEAMTEASLPSSPSTNAITALKESKPDTPVLLARPDALDPEKLADLQPVAPEADVLQASVDSAEAEAILDDVSQGILPQDQAEARYAVTGVWQRAPAQPLDVFETTAQDIYVAAVDEPIFVGDAVALPTAVSLSTDHSPQQQINPVAADTQFALDDRGLVVATQDGAVSPEGILVFAGRPPVLPPAYPKRITVGETAESLANSVRLASLRPQLRPTDLVEQSERATFGGRSLNELAQIRPKLRPQSAQQAANSDQAPTALALQTSLRPRLKPTNIAQLASRATPQETTPVAATPASATVVPNIPTTASVARQATIQNAINLRKVSLIGVYGTSSSRRALVRLSSGRYKKVQVGDRIDGGKVAAIGEDELRYIKGNRNITLNMPKDG